MAKVRWTKEEVYLLVDYYLQNRPAEELSKILREYALVRNLYIDEKYRNVNGINMRYMNIAYLFSEGKTGLSAYSNFDREIYEEYMNSRETFYGNLEKAYKIVHSQNITQYTNEKKCNFYNLPIDSFEIFDGISLVLKNAGINDVGTFASATKNQFYKMETSFHDKVGFIHDRVMVVIEIVNNINPAGKDYLDKQFFDINVNHFFFPTRIMYSLFNAEIMTINDFMKIENFEINSIFKLPQDASRIVEVKTTIQGMIEELQRIDFSKDLDELKLNLLKQFIGYKYATKTINNSYIGSSKFDNNTDYESLPIKSINMSVRLSNCLKDAGIRTIGEFLNTNDADFQNFKNLGDKTITEIRSIKRELLKKPFDNETSDISMEEYRDESNDIALLPDIVWDDFPIDALQISVRLSNCLKYMGIKKIGGLLKIKKSQFLKVRNMGQKTIDEINFIRKEFYNSFIENRVPRLLTYEYKHYYEGNKPLIGSIDINKESSEKILNSNYIDLQIRKLDISNRLKNKLIEKNISTIGQLVEIPEIKLLSDELNFGEEYDGIVSLYTIIKLFLEISVDIDNKHIEDADIHISKIYIFKNLKNILERNNIFTIRNFLETSKQCFSYMFTDSNLLLEAIEKQSYLRTIYAVTEFSSGENISNYNQISIRSLRITDGLGLYLEEEGIATIEKLLAFPAIKFENYVDPKAKKALNLQNHLKTLIAICTSQRYKQKEKDKPIANSPITLSVDSELFNIFCDIPIDKFKMSNLLRNFFQVVGLTTLRELLSLSEEKLKIKKNFGKTKMVEVSNLKKLIYQNLSDPFAEFKLLNKHNSIDEILFYDINIFDCLSASVIQQFNDKGINTLFDLVFCPLDLINNLDSDIFNNILLMKESMFYHIEDKPALFNNLLVKIDPINNGYLIKDLFNDKNTDIFQKEKINKITDLVGWDINLTKEMDFDYFDALKNLKLLNTNLDLQFEKLITTFLDKEMQDCEKPTRVSRNYGVIISRYDGDTLEKIGNRLDITKERVRQIEKKAITKFHEFCTKNNLFKYFKKLAGDEKCIFLDKFLDHFEQHRNYIIYILQSGEGEEVNYISEYSLFIFDYNWYPKINEIFEDLPRIILKDKISKYYDVIKYALLEHSVNLNYHTIKKIFEIEYSLNGLAYTKCKMRLSDKFSIILENHYKEGIEVHNPIKLKEFRDYYNKYFDDGEILNSDRAITSTICRISVLCNKGKHKLPKGQLISDFLLNTIEEYIENWNDDIVLISGLFQKFKSYLMIEGIDNRYYLQGILSKKFSDKYYVGRDYLYKSQRSTLTDFVLKYIKDSKFLVTKEKIQEKFPGISDVAITQTILIHPQIVNMYGYYQHIDNFDLSEIEISRMKSKLDEVLPEGGNVHIKSVFDKTKFSLSGIFNRVGIINHNQFYNIISRLYSDEYEFNRPFIAREGTEILSGKDQILEKMSYYDEISISQIREFANDTGIKILNLIDFIDGINDLYIFKNIDEVIKLNKVLENESLLSNLDDVIEEFLGESNYESLYKFYDWWKLKTLMIEWNPWLLYSLINKFSYLFYTGVTTGRISNAVPYVARNDFNEKNIDLSTIDGEYVSEEDELLKILEIEDDV